MIKLKNISKQYGSLKVLKGIHLTISTNEVTGLLGPNGAGKSTLMKILTGTMFPSGGTCLINGKDMFATPTAIKQKIGYLHEIAPLYEWMSVESYLRFAAELKQIKPRSRRLADVKKVMEYCQINDKKDLLIQTLSKGYRQRVGIAMSLLGDPEVLVLDEPFVGIDPNQIALMRQLIQQQSGQRTVFLSSHILQEIEKTCDNVAILHKGNLLLSGSTEVIQKEFLGIETVLITLSTSTKKPLQKALDVVQHVLSVSSDDNPLEASLQQNTLFIKGKHSSHMKPILARKLIESEYDIENMTSQKHSLEEVFQSLTVPGAPS